MDDARKIRTLRAVLEQLAEVFNVGGGNCAQVACVLDEVLDGGGDFVIVAGEHPEFADHVFLRWQGLLWDGAGGYSPRQAEQAWCEAGEDDPDDAPEAAELEDFPDPEHRLVLRLADADGLLSGGFDREAFRRGLVDGLRARGWALAAGAARLGATDDRARPGR